MADQQDSIGTDTFVNFAENLLGTYDSGFSGPMFKLLGIFAALASLFFLVQGILRLKQSIEPGSAVSASSSIYLFIPAVMLWQLTGLYNIGSETVFDSGGHYLAYSQSKTSDMVDKSVEEIVRYLFLGVQFIGAFSIVRSMFIIKAIGDAKANVNQHRSPPTLAAASVYFFAGVICVNIFKTLDILYDTIGYNP